MDGLEEREGGANDAVRAVVAGRLGGVDVAFLGGAFQSIGGVRCKGLVAWDGETWTPIDGWFQGSPSHLAWFDDGGGPGLFAIGGFHLQDGGPRTNALRYRNGQWEDLAPDTGNHNWDACTTHDGKLFISGSFTTVDGQPTNGLAAWDASGWHAFPDAPNGPIWAMASYDDGTGPALIVGGAFSEAGGVAAANVASYRDGMWSALGAGLSGGHCRALGVVPGWSGSVLYAGGDFAWSGGDRVTNIARWTGSRWERLGGNAGDGGGTLGDVQALGVLLGPFFNELIVAGTFEGTHGGPDVRGIATWSEFDSTWGILRGGLGTTRVFTAATVETAHGRRVIVGGNIYDQGGKSAKNIAIWGVPCSAPTVVEQPESIVAPFESWVEFNVHAHGSMPLEYIWLKDGAPLVADDRIDGVDSTRLTISPWRYEDGGVYECWVLNDFGSAISDPATLTIPGGGLPPVPIEMLTLTEVQSFSDPDRTIGLQPRSVAPDGGVAMFAGNHYGERHIVAWDGSSLQPIASLGDPLPDGVAQEIFASLASDPRAGTGGRLAFAGGLAGPDVEPSNDTLLCLFDGYELRTLVREGQQAPGMADGVLVGHTNYRDRIMFTERGSLIIVGNLTGAGYDLDQDAAMWEWSEADGFRLIAASQQIAPGGDVAWVGMSGGPVLGDEGRVYVHAGLDSMTGYKNFGGIDSGLWLESGGELAPVAKSGDWAPGFPADVNFEFFRDPVALPRGLHFSSRVAGPNDFDSFGLWSWTGSDVQPVVIEGDALPSGPPEPPLGGAYVWPSVLRANANDALVFNSVLDTDCGSDCANRGVFLLKPDGVLTALAYNRSPALPGMDGLTIESLPSHLLNSRNQIVLEAGLGFPEYLSGLLGWDPLRGLFPIIVPGTRIETSPGVTRVVMHATLARTYDPDPLTASGLGDDGMLTANIEFTDWPGALVRTSWADARDAYFPCRADVDVNETVDSRDVVKFLNLWTVRDWGADFTDDGRVDTTDVIAFLNAWVAGCS
jgi:hypothetical protein